MSFGVDLSELESKAQTLCTIIPAIKLEDLSVLEQLESDLDWSAKQLLKRKVWGLDAQLLLGFDDSYSQPEVLDTEPLKFAGVIIGAKTTVNPFDDPPQSPVLLFKPVEFADDEGFEQYHTASSLFNQIGIPLIGVSFEIVPLSGEVYR